MIIDEKRAGEVVKSGEWLKILFDDMTLSCGGDMVIRIDDLESMLNDEMGIVNDHAIDVYRMETWDREKRGELTSAGAAHMSIMRPVMAMYINRRQYVIPVDELQRVINEFAPFANMYFTGGLYESRY